MPPSAYPVIARRPSIPSKLCNTPSFPLIPGPVDIKNFKQLLSRILSGTIKIKATVSIDILEKTCLLILIPTAVFHML